MIASGVPRLQVQEKATRKGVRSGRIWTMPTTQNQRISLTDHHRVAQKTINAPRKNQRQLQAQRRVVGLIRSAGRRSGRDRPDNKGEQRSSGLPLYGGCSTAFDASGSFSGQVAGAGLATRPHRQSSASAPRPCRQRCCRTTLTPWQSCRYQTIEPHYDLTKAGAWRRAQRLLGARRVCQHTRRPSPACA